jgi:hypothetical protein
MLPSSHIALYIPMILGLILQSCNQNLPDVNKMPIPDYRSIKLENVYIINRELYDIDSIVESTQKFSVEKKEQLIRKLFKLNRKLDVFLPKEKFGKRSDTFRNHLFATHPYCFPFVEFSNNFPLNEITILDSKSEYLALDTLKTFRNNIRSTGWPGEGMASIRIQIYYNIYRILIDFREENHFPYFVNKIENQTYQDIFTYDFITGYYSRNQTAFSIDSLFTRFEGKFKEMGLKKIIDEELTPLKNSGYHLILLENANDICNLEQQIADSVSQVLMKNQ